MHCAGLLLPIPSAAHTATPRLCVPLRQPPPAASELRGVLDHEACTSLTASSPDFWVLAAALRRFLDEHGMLPLEARTVHIVHTMLRACLLQADGME